MISNGQSGALHAQSHALTTTPQKLISKRDEQPPLLGFICQNQSDVDVAFSQNPNVSTSAGPNLGFILKGGQPTPTAFSDVLLNCDLYFVASSDMASAQFVISPVF